MVFFFFFFLTFQLIFQQLSSMIPKSEVGVLSADSNNVVDLIKTAYSVSSQPPAPSFVITCFLSHDAVDVFSVTEIIFQSNADP